ncbi:MAG: hypothetical protein HY454_00440 [Parcubacteria group bacterium]|nr:hypothetical protein [Parcubacteria group bacterium]
MTRTQIYLPQTQIEKLRQEAYNRNSNVSAVVRMILNEHIKKPRQIAAQKADGLLETAKKINKLGPKGPPDLASKLDRHLYGSTRAHSR